ncbi:MAG: CPBP family intramembrane metalloprotease [Lachnospiraceae bacterium]|nr:CPBP family intramembrane metalloprotease [Lachnospiraceae bacterium]
MYTFVNDALTIEQKQTIFENMSDGIITVSSDGTISYVNTAASKILEIPSDSLLEQSFDDTLLANKKNKSFNHIFHQCLKRNRSTSREVVSYYIGNLVKYFRIKITLINQPEDDTPDYIFQGMLVLIEDITDKRNLRQHERDCAMLFAGIVMCITIYLSVWSLLRFTLHVPVRISTYTLMIECMTLALFLVIVFFTSFSFKEVGIIPSRNKFLPHAKQTLAIAAFASAVLLISKFILQLFDAPVKSYYIGGSIHGAITYIFTALLQEFLARGVLQTSVKTLMRVKYQIPISILLTSMLFSLMHLPFGFTFMMGTFVLSIALGVLYEQQKSIWGCFFLHWSVGYLSMCLFF